MCSVRLLFFCLLGALFCFFSPSAAAKLNVTCSDSDGGLNLSRGGEVTVKALNGDTILLERTFRDRNWLSEKSYVEFYCDEKGRFPKYEVFKCDATPSRDLPPGACPSPNRGSIMLEAKHGSLQPKNIRAAEQTYLPYYAVTLSAPVEDVWVQELRFEIELEGLERGRNTWVKFATGADQLSFGQAMLAWDNDQSGVVVLRLDQPLRIRFLEPLTIKMWFQGLVEAGTGVLEDNQISVSIKDLVLEPEARSYYESKPQTNRFSPY